MDWLIEELLNYNFENYHELVKSNYRSRSDPLFSWGIPKPTGEVKLEQVEGRGNLITIKKTDFDSRIYMYSLPTPEDGEDNKKGFYLIKHNYLELNVYLCIGNNLLIRLQDIKGIINAFIQIKKISKRCYVTYESNRDTHRYVVDFLQLYGSKDVRMLERVKHAGGQNIQTIVENLKNCDIVTEDDLRTTGNHDMVHDFDASWFDKNQGDISVFSFNNNFQLFFDDALDLDDFENTKSFIDQFRVCGLIFHIDDTNVGPSILSKTPPLVPVSPVPPKRLVGTVSPSTSETFKMSKTRLVDTE